jgi:DNA-binding transcriptional ArsR family regulator
LLIISRAGNSRFVPASSRKPTLADTDKVFLALAHEARRHVVALLAHLGGELPSGYLAARFQHSWPTTTRHLKVLEEAGIVVVRREGRGAHYRLDRERVRDVVGGWLANLTPVGPEQKWTSTGPKTSSALRTRKGTRR